MKRADRSLDSVKTLVFMRSYTPEPRGEGKPLLLLDCGMCGGVFTPTKGGPRTGSAPARALSHCVSSQGLKEDLNMACLRSDGLEECRIDTFSGGENVTAKPHAHQFSCNPSRYLLQEIAEPTGPGCKIARFDPNGCQFYDGAQGDRLHPPIAPLQIHDEDSFLGRNLLPRVGAHPLQSASSMQVSSPRGCDMRATNGDVVPPRGIDPNAILSLGAPP